MKRSSDYLPMFYGYLPMVRCGTQQKGMVQSSDIRQMKFANCQISTVRRELESHQRLEGTDNRPTQFVNRPMKNLPPIYYLTDGIYYRLAGCSRNDGCGLNDAP
jgi:hypothetical protein